MAYTRMIGEGGAFGWHQGQALVLGGLEERREYLLLCETGTQPFTSDAGGSARVPLRYGAPLCVAVGTHVVLYDGDRVSREAATALVAARHSPPPRTEPTIRQAPISEVPAAVPEPPRPTPPDERAPAQPVPYRAPSDAPPVDALPALIWPAAAEQLRPYFEKNRPLRLLSAPGWRTVRVQQAGLPCCLGYRAEGDRVSAVLYAVRARGSMLPPKGLQGYRYERLADGGYWVLRQRV